MEDAPGATGRSDEGQSRAHPLITKLLESIGDDESVVELRGFIGPTREGDDTVTLYRSLELTECVLVPRDAIAHVVEPDRERANEDPTRIYVKGSTDLRLITRRVTTIRADEASSTWSASKPIEGVGTSIPAFVGSGPLAVVCGSELSSCLRQAGSDFHRQIECISNYVKCVEVAQRLSF